MQKITIVEDDPAMREELVLLLENEGYQVQAITEFTEVVAQVRAFGANLVLLDLGLPGRDGFSLCADLRKTCGVPIILVTSRNSTMDELRALSLGGDDYITKPVSYTHLDVYKRQPQQSTETQLWVVRADTLEEAFSGEADTAKRMSVIKSQGKNRQGFCPVTLREAAAALARKEPLLLPALEVGEQGLAFAGFALYQEGGITQWLTGPEALGAALLLGDRVHWTGSVEAQAMVLQSTGCRVVPQMEEGRLTGLSIRCRLEGVLDVYKRQAPESSRSWSRVLSSPFLGAYRALADTTAASARRKVAVWAV